MGVRHLNGYRKTRARPELSKSAGLYAQIPQMIDNFLFNSRLETAGQGREWGHRSAIYRLSATTLSCFSVKVNIECNFLSPTPYRETTFRKKKLQDLIIFLVTWWFAWWWSQQHLPHIHLGLLTINKNSVTFFLAPWILKRRKKKKKDSVGFPLPGEYWLILQSGNQTEHWCGKGPKATWCGCLAARVNSWDKYTSAHFLWLRVVWGLWRFQRVSRGRAGSLRLLWCRLMHDRTPTPTPTPC